MLGHRRAGGLPPDPDDAAARAALVGLLMAGYGLTRREGEVMFHVLRGVTGLQALADVLFVERTTAKDHYYRALRKLGCVCGAEAVWRLWGWYAATTRAAGAPAASETKEAA